MTSVSVKASLAVQPSHSRNATLAVGMETSARSRIADRLDTQLDGSVYVHADAAVLRSANVGIPLVPNATVRDPASGNSGLPGSGCPAASKPNNRAVTPF